MEDTFDILLKRCTEIAEAMPPEMCHSDPEMQVLSMIPAAIVEYLAVVYGGEAEVLCKRLQAFLEACSAKQGSLMPEIGDPVVDAYTRRTNARVRVLQQKAAEHAQILPEDE